MRSRAATAAIWRQSEAVAGRPQLVGNRRSGVRSPRFNSRSTLSGWPASPLAARSWPYPMKDRNRRVLGLCSGRLRHDEWLAALVRDPPSAGDPASAPNLPALCPGRRVLREELLDAGFRRGQGCAGLPLRDELAVREQLREFFGDRVGVGLVVAGQHQARRLDLRDEGAVDAIDEAGGVEVPAERVEHLLGGLRMVFEGFGPAVKAGGAAGRHRADAADRLCQHGALDALGLMLDQVQDERAADALAVEVTAVDAQMVEEGDVVGGVAVPTVLRGDRGARLAAGVALVHRDDPELVGELRRRVDRRRGLAPHVDDRLQPRRRKGQDRKALAELLVM